MKLKTLEEIKEENFEAGCDYNMAFSVIKEEAVKWVNDINLSNEHLWEYLGCTKGEMKRNNQTTYNQLVILWIKHFFNITSKDIE